MIGYESVPLLSFFCLLQGSQEDRLPTAQSQETDAEEILRRNESKLLALEKMRTASGSLDPEALEVFLKKYVLGVSARSQGKHSVESSRLKHSTNQDDASIPGTPLTDTNETIIETLNTPMLPSRGCTDLFLDVPVLQLETSEDEITRILPSNLEKTIDPQQVGSTAQESMNMSDTLDLEMKKLNEKPKQVPPSPSMDLQSHSEVESTKTLLADTQWMPAL